MEASRLMGGLLRSARLRQRAVVLLYHAVGGQPLSRAEQRYRVSLPDFREHLRRVERAGRTVVTLRDVWRGGPTPAAGQACLTFDDGYQSDHAAVFPELRARGWGADFFVNPGTVGKPGYLEWRQIREMADAGMGFQSHSYDHVVLSRLPEARLREQLRSSKRAIEDATGRPVEFLAAPFGLWTRRVLDVTLDEGYRALCTSWSWPARPGRATISRVAVYAATTTATVGRLLDGDWTAYGRRAVRAGALYGPTRLLLRARPALWT